MLVAALIIAIISVFILSVGMKYTGPGSECSRDSDCPNGACGRSTYSDGSPYICCPSGKTTSVWLHDYCTGLSQGTPCGSDDMCQTGLCDRGSTNTDLFSGFGLKGTCQKKCAGCAGYRCENVGEGRTRCVDPKTGRKGNITTKFSRCC